MSAESCSTSPKPSAGNALALPHHGATWQVWNVRELVRRVDGTGGP
jgi:hypothetical protein